MSGFDDRRNSSWMSKKQCYMVDENKKYTDPLYPK